MANKKSRSRWGTCEVRTKWVGLLRGHSWKTWLEKWVGLLMGQLARKVSGALDVTFLDM